MIKKCFLFVILSAQINFSGYALAEPRPMKARQSAFRLEFEVYRTEDMPPNWFRTYDGFYVTKRIDNNWVYGQRTMDGMKMTNIIVGSVDPSDMPELNEAYTYVQPGVKPVYIPPLPPEVMQKIMIQDDMTARLTASTVETSAPARKPLKTRNPYELAKTGTPDELREAVRAGVVFNVKISEFDENSLNFDINYEFGNDETPLHRAAYYNHNPESIKFLVSLGLDINAYAWNGAAGRYGGSPLFFAIQNENLDAIEALLDKGADLNDYGGAGVPINMFTAAIYNGYDVTNPRKRTSTRQIIDMLIKAGGNINLHDEYSRNSEEAKQVRGEIAKYGLYSLSSASESLLVSSRTALINAVTYDDPDAVNIFA